MASLDIVLGDNYRYDFDYYIENGYNLSLVLNLFNQFNRNVTSDIGSLNFESLGLNTIILIFRYDKSNLFQSLFVQKFFWWWRLGYKFLKIKSETLANGPDR
jgi:NTE family protein